MQHRMPGAAPYGLSWVSALPCTQWSLPFPFKQHSELLVLVACPYTPCTLIPSLPPHSTLNDLLEEPDLGLLLASVTLFCGILAKSGPGATGGQMRQHAGVGAPARTR